MQQYHPSPQYAHTPPQGASQPHSCSGAGSPAQGPGPGANYPPYHPQEAAQAYNYGVGDYGYYYQDGVYAPVEAAAGYKSWFDFSNACYLKGFLVGAGVTLLLTNPTTQKALVRGAVKIWSFVQGGVEEVKEQFQDVKAEMSQERK